MQVPTRKVEAGDREGWSRQAHELLAAHGCSLASMERSESSDVFVICSLCQLEAEIASSLRRRRKFKFRNSA